ncbi:MAG: protein kinase [Nannocystis sp.]|nr:protein kinase [Nannocystis sp.]
MFEIPTTIGRYTLHKRLGCGAHGEVYEAYDPVMHRAVALKLLHGGPHSAAEIRALARLDHPNIVPIYEAGEHEGWLYFTMKLMQGTLAEDSHKRRYLADPEAASALVETMANAVFYLNQRGLLHRDLKPANILFDGANVPYLADFGLARLIDDEGDSKVAGTRPYMSPEQLDGQHSVHSDIYSLGVIFYELITGRRPFEASTTAGLIEAIRERAPTDPHRLRRGLHKDLVRACLRCLEKRPEDRYQSAAMLEEALKRYRRGDLPEGASRRRRTWHWCLNHPFPAFLLVTAVMCFVIMIPTITKLLREQAATKLAQQTQANTHLAAMVAGTVLSQLRELSDKVTAAAGDPLLAESVRARDFARILSQCDALYRANDAHGGREPGLNSPFDSWFVLDVKGRLIAQTGKEMVKDRDPDYAWRDYYIGAKAIAAQKRHHSHVSKVFRSENDDRHKFALSTPIYASNGEMVGVLVAAVAASAHLGSLLLEDPPRVTVLAGPRDRERRQNPAESHLILLHPEYQYGEADPLLSAEVRRLDHASRGVQGTEEPLRLSTSRITSSDDYRDPAAARYPKFEGRWVAGFAPVGNTGFVVIVQSPYADLLEGELRFGRTVLTWAIISVTPGVGILILGIGWRVFGRRRRRLAV